MLSRRVFFIVGGVAVLGGAVARAQSAPDYELPPVRYSATAPNDALSRLNARLSAG
jgi:hypothetical protein